MLGLELCRSTYKMMISTKFTREVWIDGAAGSSMSGQEEVAWKYLWNMQVPGKIRMFLWQLEKHSLTTKDVHCQRNMATSSAYGICGMKDSLRHSLIERLMSRCIWALVDEEITEHMIATTEHSAKQWVFQMMESMSHESSMKLAVTLWATWLARRKAIHEGVFQSPFSTRLCQEFHCWIGGDVKEDSKYMP